MRNDFDACWTAGQPDDLSAELADLEDRLLERRGGGEEEEEAEPAAWLRPGQCRFRRAPASFSSANPTPPHLAAGRPENRLPDQGQLRVKVVRDSDRQSPAARGIRLSDGGPKRSRHQRRGTAEWYKSMMNTGWIERIMRTTVQISFSFELAQDSL
jgi:hypothetical protein